MKKIVKSGIYASCLSVGFLLAGCSSEADTSKESTATEQSAEAEENSTKTYKDALGREVEIPTNPKKVVALWTVGEMLALDAKPIGSTTTLLRYFTEEEKDGIEIVGDAVTGDYEKILGLNPDLIVLYGLAKEEEIEQFSKIAPTVTTAFFGEPMASLRSMGEILNKKDEAEAWIDGYNKRVEDAREEVKDLNLQDEKAVVLQLAQKNIFLYRSSTFPTIYDAYQLNLSDYQTKLQKDEKFAKEQISMESLPEFKDVDRLFLIINDDDSKATYEKLQKSSVWKDLPAVKKDQVYVMDNRFSMADVTTLDWALDEVKGKLK